MVMETNQTDDTQISSAKYAQHAYDSSNTKKPNAKSDSVQNSKNFQSLAEASGGPAQRQFGQGFGDGMQRPGIYTEGIIPGSVEQPHFPPPTTMSSSGSTPAASTPTLNQLLTQTPLPPKYPSGGGYSTEYPGGAGGANPPMPLANSSPAMYDSWNASQQNSVNPSAYASNMAAPGRSPMPLPNRPMGPHSMQMGGMYDRAGQPIHPPYRHPNTQFSHSPAGPNYRMMGHPGYPPQGAGMEANQSGAENSLEVAGPGHQRSRSSNITPAGRMMGPPRAPGSHHIDSPNLQMMPPPAAQGQGYSSMHMFGSHQHYRGGHMPPYSNYPNSQAASPLSRGQAQPGFPQGPTNQVNGPHKPVSSANQPINLLSPGNSIKGVSPAPNPQMNLASSPASSIGQGKGVSPCPSPSVRSMPPSPSTAQLNSPHPGMSPRPESVASPRTDIQQQQQQHPLSTHSAISSPAQSLASSASSTIPEQSSLNNGQLSTDQQANSSAVHPPTTSLPPQQQVMLPHHQLPPRMPNSVGMPPGAPGTPPHQPPPGMGNGMSYPPQRMPMGQPYPHNRPPVPGAFPPHSAPYPIGQQPPMPYPPPSSNTSWPLPQKHSQPPSAGGAFAAKNDKNAVPSPLSSVPSPAAVASPHGSEGSRRPSSRKSDSGGGSSKSQKSIAANTVHGTNLEVFNKQVDLGPATENAGRRQFMDHLCAFYLENCKPLTSMPCIGKNPLDLYKVYHMVKEKGGFQQVCKKKLWKQVGTASAASTAANAAYTLKKAYIKFLLNYECKFDQGGVDPQVVLNSVETKKERQNRNAPSPGSSGNSQDGLMRGYPDYNMGPGGHLPPHPGHPAHPGHPGHPGHMGGAPMRPGQYHDPNIPPHQQQHPGYMNYNSMAGQPPPGPMPNGHHAMPPQQMNPAAGAADDQSQMSAQPDPSSDPFRSQQMNPQFNNQQGMSGPSYLPRHPYYGPRMPPPPGSQRPPLFHQQPSPSPGPQQPSQMRLPQAQSAYPPMYRDGSYPNNQAGMPPAPPTHSTGYPSVDSQSTRTPSLYSHSFAAAGASQSPLTAASASHSTNMAHSRQHSTPLPNVPRYPMRGGHPTPTRGALSAMLSNTSSAPDMRPSPGMPWRSRASMPPPGYHSHMPGEQPMSRRQLPMSRSSMSSSKKEVEFPPESVEATQPRKVRRRVLHSKDVGKVDPWKLVMCLRSGLLCECIWALDTITILLRDEHMSAMRFNLRNTPGLLDILFAHYKQSLALVFEELSDLTDTVQTSCTSSSDQEEYSLEDTKVTLLHATNYSWNSRTGMKVIVDSDLKQGQMIPSPSMYSRKAYTSCKADRTVVTTFELGTSSDIRSKHFRKYVNANKKYEESVTSPEETALKDDDVATLNSPTPTSPTSGGTEFSAQSVQTEKRMLMDGGISQFPTCNGCITPDLKAEFSEHSCESSDVSLSAKSSDTQTKFETNSKSSVELKSSIDEKMAESAEGLKTLEAKLVVSRKRRFSESLDEEPFLRESDPLEVDVDERLEELSVRCTTLSNIIRGFSFIAENEKLLAEHQPLLGLFGRLLKLRVQTGEQKARRCWWWECLENLREHTLVTLSNVAGHIQLINMPDKVCYPLMESILFWTTTSSVYAYDPLPDTHSLSARNLTLEILCKLCAHAENMNFLLATPPVERLRRLFQNLAKLLADTDQVRREFALVIISCLAQADPAAARGLAVQPSCVSQLISILESAEAAAFSIAQQRGVSALRDNPEAMGTSLDMIRRTSGTLVEMAQVEENHDILLQQQDRLLNLVMSQILDQHVAKMLSGVLYECTRNSPFDIKPSYVISDEVADHIKEEKMDETETKQSSQSSPSVDQPEQETKILNEEDSKEINLAEVINHQPELDKENINKSSILESNSAIGMISAAS